MGEIRINDIVYSTDDINEIIYKNNSLKIGLDNTNTILNSKPVSHFVTESDYTDVNNDEIYYVSSENGQKIGANNVQYTPLSKKKSVNIQDAIDECYLEVVEGKSKIASTITSKGVSTNSTDTFSTINNNIKAMATKQYNDAYKAAKVAAQLGNATAANVLAGKTFTNSSSVNITGTMTNNGAVSKSFNPSSSAQNYIIPAGYHNGSGKVTLNASTITSKKSLSLYLSHRHYTSSTCTTDFNVQGYNKLSKTMSDTANISSAKITGYKPDGSDGVTINSTVGNKSGIDISPYYKIRIQSTSSSADDKDHHMKYIGTFKFEI